MKQSIQSLRSIFWEISIFGSYLTYMIFSWQDKHVIITTTGINQITKKFSNHHQKTNSWLTHDVTQGFAYACTHDVQWLDCCLDGLGILDVKLFEHVLEIPIERTKIWIQKTLIKVLGLTYEHACLELIDSNPIRNLNSPIMDISSPFHHDPTKLML
jgi:hypothetical protein